MSGFIFAFLINELIRRTPRFCDKNGHFTAVWPRAFAASVAEKMSTHNSGHFPDCRIMESQWTITFKR